ncbi:MAG: FAD-dependent oxidoreductase [Candidatus Pacearchaeota archaeon]|nr:FAD-dependent oxidoreductase [Candidatus Pacearchaeota archaeon]
MPQVNLKSKEYDLCIVGAGPAGLAAGIYAARYKLNAVIIGKELGGRANYPERIENYPGFIGTGIDLMKKMISQTKHFGVEILNQEVLSIEKSNQGFKLNSEKESFHSKAVIIASGSEKKKLGIKGESELTGRGVSYCSTCDAFFFKKKDVVVVGGGEAAAKTALFLSTIANKVYLIYRGDKLKCCDKEKRELKSKVEVIYNSQVKEIQGKEQVESIILDNKRKIKVSGVFIEIGSVPVLDLVEKLGVKGDENYILVNQDMSTNIPGIFAAGDVTKTRLKQVVVAASQGAIAAKSAYDYLRG